MEQNLGSRFRALAEIDLNREAEVAIRGETTSKDRDDANLEDYLPILEASEEANFLEEDRDYNGPERYRDKESTLIAIRALDQIPTENPNLAAHVGQRQTPQFRPSNIPGNQHQLPYQTSTIPPNCVATVVSNERAVGPGLSSWPAPSSTEASLDPSWPKPPHPPSGQRRPNEAGNLTRIQRQPANLGRIVEETRGSAMHVANRSGRATEQAHQMPL